MKPFAPGAVEAQLFGLSTLVQLVKRARHAATVQELGFIVVNETHALVPYRQAVLWQSEGSGRGKLVAISGTPVIERNAPFTLWLKRAFAKLDTGEASAPVPVGAASLPGSLGQEWSEWLPAHGLWVPLRHADKPLGALLLARDQAWSEGDRHLIAELADGYAQASAVLRGRRRAWFGWMRGRRTVLKLAAAAALIGVMWLPISLSALAPAEVVALNPVIVRAPLDGVVDQFKVQPNQEVAEGQLLLELDRRVIENKLEIANKALQVAEAEYRQAAQQALFDDKSRAQLAVLRGRMDQRRADATYTHSLLDRIQVTASRPGLALFSDPNEWVGRPVSIGERLLEIADPAQVEFEIWLPVGDAIALQPGAEVEFFLNVAPDSPLSGRLRLASYEAAQSPAGVLGYRLKAERLGEGPPPRIGLRGTAKVYGDRVTLFYYLMRRPLAAARQLVGF